MAGDDNLLSTYYVHLAHRGPERAWNVSLGLEFAKFAPQFCHGPRESYFAFSCVRFPI